MVNSILKNYTRPSTFKISKNKVIDNLFDIGANIGVICIPGEKRLSSKSICGRT